MKPLMMKALLAGLVIAAGGFEASAQTTIRVGFCAKTVSAAGAAAIAVATKMGWFAKDGVKVELVPMAGSGDCVKAVATKDVLFSIPSIEPLAVISTRKGFSRRRML